MFKQSSTTILLVLTLLIGGCMPSEQPRLRVGTNLWIGYEPLYVAEHLNLLDKRQYKLVELASASQVAKAFEQGLIDVAALTLDELLRLATRSSDYTVMLITDYSYGGDAIVAQSAYHSLSQLKGANIDLEDDAVGDFLFYRAIQLNGLNYQDFTIVPLHVNQHAHAFTQAQVQAVATFEPVRTQLLSQGAVELFNSRQIPGEIIDILVVRKSIEEQFEPQLKQLIKVWFETVTRIQRKDKELMALLSKRLGVNQAAVEKMLQDIKIPPAKQVNSMIYNSKPTLINNINKVIEFLNTQDISTQSIDVDALFPTKNYIANL